MTGRRVAPIPGFLSYPCPLISAGDCLISALPQQKAGLLPMLRDGFHRPLTMLWPTDLALKALPPDRQAWLYHEDHRDKLAAILRGHVIRNVEVGVPPDPGSHGATEPNCTLPTVVLFFQALASDLPNLGSLRTMHGTPISFSCSRARPVSAGCTREVGRGPAELLRLP